MSDHRSNWARATARFREGFLITPPRSFMWTTAGRYFVDDISVSEPVYDLAEAGQLADARTLWLAGFEST